MKHEAHTKSPSHKRAMPGGKMPSHGTLRGSSITGDLGVKRQNEGDALGKFKNAGPIVKASSRL